MIKKILICFIGIFIAGLAFAYFSRDWILKAALEHAATRLTGFDTKVEALHFDFPSTLRVQGLVIRNPQGFREAVFAELPEIYISLELKELLKGERIHLPELRLNLKEINVEKNEKGISNVSLLTSVKGAKEKPAPAEKKKAMPFLLNRLELTIHQVHYVDYSGLVPKGIVPGIVPEGVKGLVPTGIINKGADAVVPSAIAQKKVSMDLKIEKQVFVDITDPKAVVNVILVKVLYGKTFGNFKELGVDPGEMLENLKVQNTVKDVLGSGQELFQQTSGLVSKDIKGVVGGATHLFGKLKPSPPEERSASVAS